MSAFNVWFDYFNLAIPTNEWTKRRLDIFEKTTLRSIGNQTNKNFKYIVFFYKPACDEDDIVRIDGYSDITPIFLDEPFNSKIHLKPILEKDTKDGDVVVVTKIDSDDILYPTFVDVVYGLVDTDFLDRNKAFYCFPKGYRYRLYDYSLWKEKWTTCSIFTIVERIIDGELQSAFRGYDYKHTEVSRMFKSQKLQRPVKGIGAMWLKYDSEVSMNVRNKDKMLANKIKHKFIKLVDDDLARRVCDDFNIPIDSLK